MTYFCKGNIDYYEYFDNWLCNIFQHPDKKNKTAIVLKSTKHGIGKGMLINDLIGLRIFGENSYVQVSTMDDILGKFSSLGCNKLLINPDEAICCAKDATVFKNKITEPNTTMEKRIS